MIAAGFKLETAKAVFFDSQRVMKEMDARTRKALSRFGAFVRQTARKSLEESPASAASGNAPFIHGPKLPKSILFAADLDEGSVVIGPILFNKKSGYLVPEVLEEGGTVMARVQGWATVGDARQKVMRMIRKHFGPHPFMKPAFDRELAKTHGGADCWKE